MQYAHFVPGGAEADEAAIKIARQYHHLRGDPHRMKVITRQGSFHGVTQGAMALDGGYFASRNVIYDGGLSWGRTAPPRRVRNATSARPPAIWHAFTASSG